MGVDFAPWQSFDSSQLVTIACQGFSDVDQAKLDTYRQMYRPVVTATFGNRNRAFGSQQPTAMAGDGNFHSQEETPEVQRVRDRLGLRSVDSDSGLAGAGDDGGGDATGARTSRSDKSDLSSAGAGARTDRSDRSDRSSARLSRRRFLGSLGQTFGRSPAVRRSASTGIPRGSADGGHFHGSVDQESVNEQIMQVG